MAFGTAPTDNSSPNANAENTSRKIVLHVLCPSLPPPSRFTFHDFTLSSTVASIKARISESVPSRPPPASQRLIYCGKPITDDALILQSVLEPVESTEYSIHLILPPAPTPSTPTPSSVGTSTNASTLTDTARTHIRHNPLHASRSASSAANNIQTNVSGLRFRGTPAPPPLPDGLGDADVGLALRRNIDSIRRQIEEHQRALSGHPQTQEATTAFPNPLSSQVGSAPFPRPNPWQRTPDNPSNPLQPAPEQPPFSGSAPVFAVPPNGTTAPNSMPREAAAQLEMFRTRLPVVQAQIALCEDQLNHGNAPAMEHIIRIRTHLFHHLDTQYLNPLGPRDGVVESLLTRVSNVYTRADQLRVIQSRSAQHQSTITNPPTTDPSDAPLHLLTSPDGYQALVASPNVNETLQASLAALRAAQSPGTAPVPPGHAHQPGLQQNAEAAVLHNAVRQAVLNQHLGNAQNAQLGFARNLRRIWLFVRLYFFCYMFSEPGTWTRILMVCVAVVLSLLSETGIPQQLYRMIVAPVRQHFESLVQFGPANAQPETRAGAERNEQEGPNAPRDEGGDLRFNLRRIERSVALFLASLIPGVGERHVQVRNAADAAERAREDEGRRQEETRQQPQDDSAANDGPEGGQNAPAENDSPYDTPGDEQPR